MVVEVKQAGNCSRISISYFTGGIWNAAQGAEIAIGNRGGWRDDLAEIQGDQRSCARMVIRWGLDQF